MSVLCIDSVGQVCECECECECLNCIRAAERKIDIFSYLKKPCEYYSVQDNFWAPLVSICQK